MHFALKFFSKVNKTLIKNSRGNKQLAYSFKTCCMLLTVYARFQSLMQMKTKMACYLIWKLDFRKQNAWIAAHKFNKIMCCWKRANFTSCSKNSWILLEIGYFCERKENNSLPFYVNTFCLNSTLNYFTILP